MDHFLDSAFRSRMASTSPQTGPASTTSTDRTLARGVPTANGPPIVQPSGLPQNQQDPVCTRIMQKQLISWEAWRRYLFPQNKVSKAGLEERAAHLYELVQTKWNTQLEAICDMYVVARNAHESKFAELRQAFQPFLQLWRAMEEEKRALIRELGMSVYCY